MKIQKYLKTICSTEPVAINVKPLPDKNKPADLTVLREFYYYLLLLVKNELAKNEEGDLGITISGKGNFTQLSCACYSMAGWYGRF